MAINFADAVSAYRKAALRDGTPGIGAPGADKGKDFADVLRGAAEGAMEALRESETQSLKAAAGSADITDVVTAVSKAEMTLQTVVALRDRVIQAYQEIIRMPI